MQQAYFHSQHSAVFRECLTSIHELSCDREFGTKSTTITNRILTTIAQYSGSGFYVWHLWSLFLISWLEATLSLSHTLVYSISGLSFGTRNQSVNIKRQSSDSNFINKKCVPRLALLVLLTKSVFSCPSSTHYSSG